MLSFILDAVSNLYDYFLEVLHSFFVLLIPFCLFDFFYLQFKLEERREKREFDLRVLAFLNGLVFSCPELCRYSYDLPRYAERMLQEAHKLPGNESVYTYHDRKRRLKYSAWTCPNDYALFAVLCIARFAEEYELDEVLSWCDHVIDHAKRTTVDKVDALFLW